MPRCSSTYRRRDPTQSILRSAVRQHLATFESQCQADARTLPSFVSQNLRRFIDCGDLSKGLARFVCEGCKYEHLAPLSCKGRGLCPTCGGRRMRSLSQHLVDAVLPDVPLRQWVLTLPYPLRYPAAFDQKLCTEIHRIFARTLHASYRRSAEERGQLGGQSGAVTFVQRFGSALNLNPHFHLLAIDGTFHRQRSAAVEAGADPGAEEPEALRFVHAPPLTQQKLEALLLKVHRKLLRMLQRRGLLEDGLEDPLAEQSPALAACYQGAVSQRLALGPHRGRPAIQIQTDTRHAAECVVTKRRLSANLDGLDLHAALTLGADQRQARERLLRYCARPPLSDERLTELPDGHYLLKLKTPWRNGTTHHKLQPLELMERLAAQIPEPNSRLVLYTGCLAPNAKLRPLVVRHARSEDEPDPAELSRTRPERERWAELMKRSFGLDVRTCPRCGGYMQHIATILEHRVAQKILQHLKLPCTPPATGPPADPPPFWPAPVEDDCYAQDDAEYDWA